MGVATVMLCFNCVRPYFTAVKLYLIMFHITLLIMLISLWTCNASVMICLFYFGTSLLIHSAYNERTKNKDSYTAISSLRRQQTANDNREIVDLRSVEAEF